MQAARPDGSPTRGLRTSNARSSIHALQFSGIARLTNLDAIGPAPPSLSSSMSPHTLTPSTPSSAPLTIHSHFTHNTTTPGTHKPSVSAPCPKSDDNHSSVLDGFSTRALQSFTEPSGDRTDDLGFQFSSHFSVQGTDDDEDLRDLSAIKLIRSINMNLDALTRIGTGHYAYNAEGYTDPNVEYGGKALEDAQDHDSLEYSYAHLISRLSIAQDDSVEEQREILHQGSYERTDKFQNQATPDMASVKDSPPATSLASGRSSSDAHEDELKTPPEPSFVGFEPTLDSARYHSRHLRPTEGSPLPTQTVNAEVSPPSQAAPPHLGSPFQQAKAQEASTRFQVGDSTELELLSDDVNAQRRAAGKARTAHWHSESPASSTSAHSHTRRRSSVYTDTGISRPFARLGPQDIAFSATTLPEVRLRAPDCIDMIVSRYPSLCDAPLRELGEDGQLLPPTKKKETSEEERQARKEALSVKYCAKQRLSLIKAMVVMESRSASWKRIGPLSTANRSTNTALGTSQDGSPRSSSEVARLPPMPSPWSMEIRHEQLDAAQIKGKSKKTIELVSLRTNARCNKCDGSGLGPCVTCKSEQADECFWCSGTGREKTRAQAWCRRCQGAGVLKCNTCHGSLKSDCRSCEGAGTGEYGFFVDVTVKRIEMPAVPISTLLPHLDPNSNAFEPSYDEVRTVATMALWDSIVKLTESRSLAVGGKGKREMVPVMAACVWENSISHIVALDVPLAAKFKKGARPALRPEGLHRKIPTKRRFFTVPSDADLRSVELTEDEVKKLCDPQPGRGHQYSSPYSSTCASPALSAIDNLSPQLATPEEGGSVSGYSTPSRVPTPRSDAPPARPSIKEFAHRPSPLSQLAATTPSPFTASFQSPGGARQPHANGQESYFSPPPHRASAGVNRYPETKERRPSAGHILTKKLSSNVLSKLGAHRGSV